VRYYERFEKAILALDFDEYFDLLITYSQALFEISEYRKCIMMSDTVIQTSVMENITHVNGVEIYCTAIFKKAAAHYNLCEYDETERILRELLKIKHYDPLSVLLYEKTLRKKNGKLIQNVRAVSIFLFLMCTLTISVEVILVRNFFEMYVKIIESSRNLMFALGVFTFLGGTLYHYWRVHNYVQNFLRKVKKEKT
jgi:hypothetical protein